LIIVDNPKTRNPYGGKVAAPIVKRIFTRIANANPQLFVSGTSTKIERSNSALRKNVNRESSLLSLQTVRYIEPKQISQDEAIPDNIMPNVKGMSLRYALKILGERNLNPKFSGGGIVKKQKPSAGERVVSGSEVLLTMETGSE
ncbi:MAG: PASTA domain-containing protein, partial [Candidatus Marinimicrobia bacterium]|nr:PASTA domain-containing protein [Candidatus Neomarinimicrobiota bacterium]